MSDLIEWAESLIGQVIGDKYEVVELLGIGGAGGVFRARHTVLDTDYALKLIVPNPHAGTTDEQEKRFVREAATSLALVHPMIVQVRDFGIDRTKELMYMAMDYVKGFSLANIIEAECSETVEGQPVIEIARALRVIRMALDALNVAHEAGIVHRDLKPGNIIVSGEGDGETIKVLDFGFAKIRQTSQEDKVATDNTRTLMERITLTGSVLGTPQYMAPEQARGKEVDHRADIYALGVILYEMLTGALPHKGANFNHMLFARATEPPIPLQEARPDIHFPDSVTVLLEFALATEPENRFEDADQFMEMIDEALEEMTGELDDEDRGDSPRRAAVSPDVVASIENRDRITRRASTLIMVEKHRFRGRMAIVGTLLFAAAVVAAILILPNYLEYSRLMADGKKAFSDARYADAIEAFDAARAHTSDVKPATREWQRARGALAKHELDRARQALDKDALDKALSLAKDSGIELAVREPYSLLRDALARAAEAQRHVSRRNFTKARDTLKAMPATVTLPKELKRRIAAIQTTITLALHDADELFADGTSRMEVLELVQLEAGAKAFDRFLKDYPDHSKRDDAREKLDTLRSRIAAIKGKSLRTELTLDTRPGGLECWVGDTYLGKASFTLTSAVLPVGKHVVRIADERGFVSTHEVAMKKGVQAKSLLDHGSAVEAERAAFDSIRPSQDAPGAIVKACKAYIQIFPNGSQRESVRMILSQALAKIEEERKLEEGAAFAKLAALKDDPQAQLKALISVAEKFASVYPASEHRSDVAAWLAAWRTKRDHLEAESDDRLALRDVLNQDDVDIDKRMGLVANHISTYIGKEFELSNEELVEELLIRPLSPSSGRLLLSHSIGKARAAVVIANPSLLAICNFGSASLESEMPIDGQTVLSLSATTDGSAVYVGTKSGSLLRWLVNGSDVEEIQSFDSPVRHVTAFADGLVIVSDSTRRGTYLLETSKDNRIARTRLKGPKGIAQCGAKSSDDRFFAIGDDTGVLLIYAVAQGKRPKLTWRTSLGGAVLSVSFSPDGTLLAASHLRGNVPRTSTWRVTKGVGVLRADHPVGNGWLQALDAEGHVLVGGLVVGPTVEDERIPLSIGAASAVDRAGAYLLGANAEGKASICYLPELLKQIRRRRESRVK